MQRQTYIYLIDRFIHVHWDNDLHVHEQDALLEICTLYTGIIIITMNILLHI